MSAAFRLNLNSEFHANRHTTTTTTPTTTTTTTTPRSSTKVYPRGRKKESPESFKRRALLELWRQTNKSKTPRKRHFPIKKSPNTSHVSTTSDILATVVTPIPVRDAFQQSTNVADVHTFSSSCKVVSTRGDQTNAPVYTGSSCLVCSRKALKNSNVVSSLTPLSLTSSKVSENSPTQETSNVAFSYLSPTHSSQNKVTKKHLLLSTQPTKVTKSTTPFESTPIISPILKKPPKKEPSTLMKEAKSILESAQDLAALRRKNVQFHEHPNIRIIPRSNSTPHKKEAHRTEQTTNSNLTKSSDRSIPTKSTTNHPIVVERNPLESRSLNRKETELLPGMGQLDLIQQTDSSSSSPHEDKSRNDNDSVPTPRSFWHRPKHKKASSPVDIAKQRMHKMSQQMVEKRQTLNAERQKMNSASSESNHPIQVPDRYQSTLQQKKEDDRNDVPEEETDSFLDHDNLTVEVTKQDMQKEKHTPSDSFKNLVQTLERLRAPDEFNFSKVTFSELFRIHQHLIQELKRQIDTISHRSHQEDTNSLAVVKTSLHQRVCTLEEGLTVMEQTINHFGHSFQFLKDENIRFQKEIQSLSSQSTRIPFGIRGSSTVTTNSFMKHSSSHHPPPHHHWIDHFSPEKATSIPNRIPSPSQTSQIFQEQTYGETAPDYNGVKTPDHHPPSSNYPSHTPLVTNENHDNHNKKHEKNTPMEKQPTTLFSDTKQQPTPGACFVFDLSGHINLEVGEHADLSQIIDRQWKKGKEGDKHYNN